MNTQSIESFNILLLNDKNIEIFDLKYNFEKYVELFLSHFNVDININSINELKKIEITNIFKLDVENILLSFGITTKFDWFIKKYNFKEGIDYLKYKIHKFKIFNFVFYNNIYIVNTKTVIKCICFHNHNTYFNYFIYISYIINAYKQFQLLSLRKSNLTL